MGKIARHCRNQVFLHDRVLVQRWYSGHISWSLRRTLNASFGMTDRGIYEFQPIDRSKAVLPKSPVVSKGPVKYVCRLAGGSDDEPGPSPLEAIHA